MATQDKNHIVDLGFAEAHLPAGTHICQIYDSDDERNFALLKFLFKGVLSNECNACFSDNVTNKMIQDYFDEQGYTKDDLFKSGALTVEKTSEVYFQNNMFSPEYMLTLLEHFHTDSLASGYSAARVIGEMSPEINSIEGGERLLEYECRVSLLLKEHPLTAVCQYNAHNFDGATIMDVLKVHPMMVVHGAVIHNPFFIPPEVYLKDKKKK